MNMSIPTERYDAQVARWPERGQHILAHYDDDTVIVYQAYRPSIATYAIDNGRFGGPDFSFTRMSWIKPNFLWMMYRSGWGTKEGQEFTLALRIRRTFFDRVIAEAVPSSHDPQQHATREAWQSAVAFSDVRLQWDPDHDPHGGKVERRAIQLGLRGDMLRALATTELVEVIDMSPFVAEQRQLIGTPELCTPRERVYEARS